MRVVAILVALAATAHAQSGDKIVEIEITGNTKTNDETVKLIADVGVGDTFSGELVERVRTDLRSSGLFKEVTVDYEQSTVKEGVKLILRVPDKHSWVIAPTFYNQPGNVGGGVGFGENNLFGENKKLLLYAQYATADSLFIAAYLDPSIAGSKYFYWRIDAFGRYEKVTEYGQAAGFDEQPVAHRESTMTYLNAGLLFGVNLVKGFALDGRLRGARVTFADAHCVDGSALPDCTQNPQDDGWDVSTEWKLTFDSRANWYGVQTGNLLQLSFEPSLPALGSTYDYKAGSVKLMHGHKYWERHNLVLDGDLQLGQRLPFQQEFTSGGVNLRGYQNRQFRGDLRAAASAEYSAQILPTIGPFALRGLVFTDLAYTTFIGDNYSAENPQRHYIAGQTDSTLDQFRVGIGAGFRIYVKSIVLPLLGLDWGYAPQANEWHMYFAVGLTEL
jgi:outer membrane protein assembly factor BamA